MIGARIKALIFTPGPLRAAKARAARRVFMKIGAFIRLTARRSLRQRKKPAPAGSPPSSHTRTLKNNILFAYEEAKQGVVIGPRALPNRAGSLAHLEDGGQAVLVRQRRGRQIRVRAQFEPHPFMKPALQAEAPKLARLWADAIR